MSLHSFLSHLIMHKSKVANYLQQLCNTTFEGGRLVQDDESTIMLYDVPMWPGTRSDALNQKFQNITIDIFQSTASISGFVVIVTSTSVSSALSSHFVVFLILFFTLISCVMCWQILLINVDDIHKINLFQTTVLGLPTSCQTSSTSSL